MRKYVYGNATVYITKPTETQLENIRKSTERFVTQLMKKGLIDDEFLRENNCRTGRPDTHARKRTCKIEKEG